MPSVQCHQCGASITVNEPLARDAECEACRADLRSCVNCRHYDTHFNNSCRETEAEPVVEKRRRNFCEFFSFTTEKLKPEESQEPKAREKLERLFKNPPGTPGEATAPENRVTDARKRLEQLFKPKDEG
jgi:hypothetical protein